MYICIYIYIYNDTCAADLGRPARESPRELLLLISLVITTVTIVAIHSNTITIPLLVAINSNTITIVAINSNTITNSITTITVTVTANY